MYINEKQDTSKVKNRTEEPMVLTKPETGNVIKHFEVYEDMPYHIEFIELSETLKLVGVAKTHD